MPCIPIKGGRRTGFLCVGKEPVEVRHKGRVYLFEWTAACGWLPITKDGGERLSPIPKPVWNKLHELPRGE